MILAGPFGPKFIAEAWVVSENVGEGGLGEALRLMEPKEKGERLGAMVVEDSEVAYYVQH
jgi:hypothetical protein